MKERLKSLLQEMGMSQAEFADYIGVGRPSITHIMTGRDKTSQTVVSKTLLKFPEINPMWLLKGEGEMYRPHSEKSVRPSEPKDDMLEDERQPLLKTDVEPTEIQATLFDEELSSSHQPVQPVQPVNVPIGPTVKKQPVKQESTEDVVKPSAPEEFSAPPSISSPTPSAEKPDAFVKGKPRKLRKIVFFYDDHSFEEYWPEEW